MDYNNKPIDVICQHTTEGYLIPIKLRFRDDEGEYQSYRIKSYKDLYHKGQFTLPNGIIATNSILPYECRIDIFGRERSILIYYNCDDNIWRLTPKDSDML
ncbi:MAG: hypothetical protein K6B28_12520 [Lachnospiraceae bacterium]|nr:hypothetical protein [Lachnospiraceae bacterium]